MLETFSITDIGEKRQLNQDFVFTSINKVGNLANVFIVADGMGGHKAGDYASKFTVETIVEEMMKSKETDVDKVIADAILVANYQLRIKADENKELDGMGTTVVVATIDNGVLHVANVGDSRLYLINQEITQITIDHSLVEEMIRVGGLDRLSARTHPDKNIITRAIGAQSDVEADFFHRKLEPGDVVLMCTDGLTNMLEDETILQILKMDGSARVRAEQLVKAANSNGGRDNISVVLIESFEDEVER